MIALTFLAGALMYAVGVPMILDNPVWAGFVGISMWLSVEIIDRLPEHRIIPCLTATGVTACAAAGASHAAGAQSAVLPCVFVVALAAFWAAWCAPRPKRGAA